MIFVEQARAAFDKTTKPVFCPKCKRGVIGHIPIKCEAVVSRRGKQPPQEQSEFVKVKCHICRSFWTLTTKTEY